MEEWTSISHWSLEHEKSNEPCLTEESYSYVCSALSNASPSGNILYLGGPLHPKPGKGNLRGEDINQKPLSKMCISNVLTWTRMVRKALRKNTKFVHNIHTYIFWVILQSIFFIDQIENELQWKYYY